MAIRIITACALTSSQAAWMLRVVHRNRGDIECALNNAETNGIDWEHEHHITYTDVTDTYDVMIRLDGE